MVRHPLIALCASFEDRSEACLLLRPAVARCRAPQNGLMARQMLKYRLPHEASFSAVLCLAQDVESEYQCAAGVCTSLLGPSAIAEDKTESGTRLDVLGSRRLVHTPTVH